MTAVEVQGGPALPQERRLVTEIPGPVSRAWTARRKPRCRGGVGDAAGVRRRGGRRRDRRRRRQLADRLRLRHRGDRPSATRRRASSRAGAGAGRARSPTPASWSRRTRATSRSARQLNRLTPGDHDKRSALFNSGAEAVENAVKIARHATGRQAVVGVRPRLPRPHQPHDGADREEHAVQARLRPVRAARSTGCRWPTRTAGRPVRRAPRRRGAADRPASTSRSAPTTWPRVIIEPIQGEGGFIVPAPTASCPALAEWCREQRRSCSSPTRSRPASAAPATWFACEHEGVVPGPDHHRQGHRRRAAAGRGHRPRRDHGRGRTPAASAAPTAATRWPAPRRSARSRRSRTTDLAGARPARSATIMLPRLRGAGRARTRVIGDVRGRGAMLAVELVRPGTARARRRDVADGRRRGLPRRGLLVLTCGTYGNVLRFLPPLSMPRTCSPRASTSSRRRSPRSPIRSGTFAARESAADAVEQTYSNRAGSPAP